jgi:hypothetical protein
LHEGGLRRGLALVLGLLAAALALYALLGRSRAPAPEEDIDEASRAALRDVLRQEQE